MLIYILFVYVSLKDGCDMRARIFAKKKKQKTKVIKPLKASIKRTERSFGIIPFNSRSTPGERGISFPTSTRDRSMNFKGVPFALKDCFSSHSQNGGGKSTRVYYSISFSRSQKYATNSAEQWNRKVKVV